MLALFIRAGAQTIEITHAKTNQRYEVAAWDISTLTQSAKGNLFIKVPYLHNGKSFQVKESFNEIHQQRFSILQNNPDGSIVISNKFRYTSQYLGANNTFVIDLWADTGIHTITLPTGIDFVESRIEDYEISYGTTALNIFYVERTHQDNVINLKITPATFWNHKGNWRGPDWFWGTHVVKKDEQNIGKRYIGSLMLKFTATGYFVIPEIQGGVFVVESLKN